jgi:uncharacterized LabA/DUF88 family protein
MKGNRLKTIIGIFLGVFIIWVVIQLGILFVFKDWTTRGTFGDSFGAVNSLFSGLAFGGLIYTILLQRKELELQRQELIETRQELKRSADAQEKSERALNSQIRALNITAEISGLNAIIDNY